MTEFQPKLHEMSNDTYLHMIGQILDHMNRNKQFLNIK